MATRALGTVLHHLRRTLLRHDEASHSDGALLEAFLTQRDAAAFEALMHRHGPMVLGVCRRILRHEADAEDAFQATFLVLVRKAASIRPRAMVGNWLYGVAHSTALKARAMYAKRRDKERAAAARPAPEAAADTWEQLQPLLDQELQALPATYRVAIVLCDLEGKTIKEAAQQLGCPPGTVGTRLARGRKLLARRLSRRGLAVSGGAVAALLAQQGAMASVPPPLLNSTLQAVATGAISARVAALTGRVLMGMLLTKLKIATACCLALGALAAGLSSFHLQAARGPEPTPARAASAEEPQAPDRKPPEPAPAITEIRGSGKVITKEFPLADFTTVEVSRNFRVELARADAFRVAITTDDNLLPHIQAHKDGATLRLGIDPKLSFWATALKATIAMPALEGLRATSASNVTLQGFKSARPFQARLAFASVLQGEIEAPSVDLDVAGGGRVALKGSAQELKISAAQACRLSLAELAVERADVTLRDGASATVNVRGTLQYDLTRASRLNYLGRPSATKGKTTDASMAVPVTADPDKGLPPGNPHHGHHGTGARPPVAIGARVPDLTLRDLAGRSVKLGELHKGAVVLCFWCSTCPSCRRVEQHLDKLARDYAGRALVLALDANAGETPAAVQACAQEKGLKLPIYLDPDGHAADLFGTTVTTTTVVIDGDGVFRYSGRFRDGDRHAYAEDALKAVLAGTDVAVKTTPHDGCGIVRR